MDKKELIINALGELFKEGKAGTASVSDIAKKAGIAKGGMYYYFRSKEEVLDALVDPSLDEYLHMPQNAAIHQKSLAQILKSLSQLVSGIMKQGIESGEFLCEYPQEYSEIIMSVFTFLLDPGIFTWTKEEYVGKLRALADMLEKGLGTPAGSFWFLYDAQRKVTV